MIGRVVQLRGGEVRADDPIFVETCLDVLGGEIVKIRKEGESVAAEEIRRLIQQVA